MAKTVDEGFRIFHSRLTPSTTESQAAKQHRSSIEACLKSNFEITRFFRTGSFGNGTSIRSYSDVDYFASIPTKNLKQDSNLTLRMVRNALDTRFPNTNVRVSTPGILVPFGINASESIEVIPADFIKKDKNNCHHYEIADGAGGWISSSPDAHNKYVADVDNKLGRKVKPLVRFLKAWKYYKNVPVSSFYLELRVAKYSLGRKSISYSKDIENIISILLNQKLPAIQDPAGISGYIKACATDAQENDALSKLETALSRAEKARAAEDAGKLRDAFHWWNLFFAEKFPSYD